MIPLGGFTFAERLILALWRNKVLVALTLSAVLLLVCWPAQLPAIFFDEGWNLMVERDWSEIGHYGLMLDGKPVYGPRSTGFPSIIPIGFSFELFRIGIWQAQLEAFFREGTSDRIPIPCQKQEQSPLCQEMEKDSACSAYRQRLLIPLGLRTWTRAVRNTR